MANARNFWKGAFEIIDESYNSSPASMMAAIEVLASARPRGSGKRIAVIEDMLELGARSGGAAANLAEPITASEIDLVFTAGSEAVALWRHLSTLGRTCLNARTNILFRAIGDGDIALVKGSQGSRMNEVVNALKPQACD